MHLTAWKARRAGGRITITGLGEDGAPAKIVGVDMIYPDTDSMGSFCAAKDKNGEVHKLDI